MNEDFLAQRRKTESKREATLKFLTSCVKINHENPAEAGKKLIEIQRVAGLALEISPSGGGDFVTIVWRDLVITAEEKFIAAAFVRDLTGEEVRCAIGSVDVTLSGR